MLRLRRRLRCGGRRCGKARVVCKIPGSWNGAACWPSASLGGARRMTAQTSNLERGRGNNFDALRFVLAAAVIYSHSHLMTGAGPDPLERLTRGQIYLGAVAVDAFFILSGYLVTASWMRSENLGKFLASRILRIHPGFIVAALLSVALIGPLGARSALAYFRELDLPALGWSFLRLKKLTVPATFEWVPGSANEVNGSLWTVCIEFECYLAVAALGLAGLLRDRKSVV